MAICLGYYELSLLLVLVFQFLRRNPKKYSRHLLLFSRSAVRTNKCWCFFQMFSIQYFILHPKILRFPFCRSFFGQRIGWRKAKRSPNGLYPRLRFVSLKEPDWQRAINNSLPNVNTIFNSCSIGNASNMLSLNSNSCCQLKNRRLSRLIAVKTSSFVQCLRMTNFFQRSWNNYQMLSLTVMSKIILTTHDL